MEHKVLNEKAMKRGCRMQTSSLDRFPIDFWNRFGARIVSKSVLPAILAPKLVPSCPKAIKNRKYIDSKTNFEVDIIFGSISDPILINFGTEIASNFDLILE